MPKISDQEFIKIYEQNKNAIFRIAFSYLGVYEDAENVMQDTFLKLYTNPPKDNFNILGWLARVARNLSLDLLRSKKRESDILNHLEDNYFNNEKEKDSFDILPLVSKLPKNYSEVIKLHYYGELSIKEISIALKISENNVKKRLERARMKLKEMMEEMT